MIAALILRSQFAKKLVANVESRDPQRVTEDYTEDVVLTFPGDPPILGKAAAEAYYTRVFAPVEQMRVTVKSLGLTRPYAVGFRNTVLCEVELEAVMKDGSTFSGPEVYAVDVQGTRITGVRYYVGSPVWLQVHQQYDMAA